MTNQFRIEKESDWFVDNGVTVHVTKDLQSRFSKNLENSMKKERSKLLKET